VLAAARADCTHAVQRKPDYVNAYQNRGAAWQTEADFLRQTGGDPAPALAEALADFQRALRHNPRFWQAHSASGWALQQLKRPHEAVAAYRAALQINPNQPFIRAQYDALRK